MDLSPLAMPVRLAIGEIHNHACIHLAFQSFVVHA
jgi:hypothetical protein